MFESIPLELIGGLIGTGMGSISQMIGNQSTIMFKLIEEQRTANEQAETNHNSAKARTEGGASWLQRGVAGVIMIVSFLGLIWATKNGYNLAIEVEKPIRSFFGLFQWGGNTEFLAAPEGSFALPQYVSVAVTSLIGYTFGRSAVKIRRI